MLEWTKQSSRSSPCVTFVCVQIKPREFIRPITPYDHAPSLDCAVPGQRLMGTDMHGRNRMAAQALNHVRGRHQGRPARHHSGQRCVGLAHTQPTLFSRCFLVVFSLFSRCFLFFFSLFSRCFLVGLSLLSRCCPVVVSPFTGGGLLKTVAGVARARRRRPAPRRRARAPGGARCRSGSRRLAPSGPRPSRRATTVGPRRTKGRTRRRSATTRTRTKAAMLVRTSLMIMSEEDV